MLYVWLVLVGVGSGVLGGMGMGGGTLLIPLLTFIFDFNQKVVQGINLISFSIMAMIVVIIHIKNKMVDIKSALMFSGLAVITTPLGALLANVINARALKIFYGILLIGISIYMATIELKQHSNLKK